VHHQGTAATKPDLRQVDLPLDHHLIPTPQAANGLNTGSVLVTQWQMKQRSCKLAIFNLASFSALLAPTPFSSVTGISAKLFNGFSFINWARFRCTIQLNHSMPE
jgi:hypothetical protein